MGISYTSLSLISQVYVVTVFKGWQGRQAILRLAGNSDFLHNITSSDSQSHFVSGKFGRDRLYCSSYY